MSHFTVLVVGDVEAQLAPFDENDRSKFTPKSAEEMKKLRAEYDADKQGYETFETFLDEWAGLEKRGKKWGSTYNPNSKWDWYVEGGRWPNMLVTKDGKACNSALVGDLDFERMRAEKRARAAAAWERAQREPERTRSLIYGIEPETTREQYLDRAGPFSTFAVVMNKQWFERGRMGWWAMVSDEKDDSAWQAEFDKLLASLPSDARVTVVDCHI